MNRDDDPGDVAGDEISLDRGYDEPVYEPGADGNPRITRAAAALEFQRRRQVRKLAKAPVDGE